MNLNPDETMRLPTAYRSMMIMAAMAKRWLAVDKLSLAERLFYLEEFDKLAFGVLTAKALTGIGPACDTFEQIFNEAMRVDTGENQAATAFGILERDDVFRGLLRLNPSLITATALCRGRG